MNAYRWRLAYKQPMAMSTNEIMLIVAATVGGISVVVAVMLLTRTYLKSRGSSAEDKATSTAVVRPRIKSIDDSDSDSDSSSDSSDEIRGGAAAGSQTLGTAAARVPPPPRGGLPAHLRVPPPPPGGLPAHLRPKKQPPPPPPGALPPHLQTLGDALVAEAHAWCQERSQAQAQAQAQAPPQAPPQERRVLLPPLQSTCKRPVAGLLVPPPSIPKARIGVARAQLDTPAVKLGGRSPRVAPAPISSKWYHALLDDKAVVRRCECRSLSAAEQERVAAAILKMRENEDGVPGSSQYDKLASIHSGLHMRTCAHARIHAYVRIRTHACARMHAGTSSSRRSTRGYRRCPGRICQSTAPTAPHASRRGTAPTCSISSA